MKTQEIEAFAKAKLAASTILVYYCLKEFTVNNKMHGNVSKIKSFTNLSRSGVMKSIVKLEQHGFITFTYENGKRKNIFFNDMQHILVKPAPTINVIAPISGVYKISSNNTVYIGESKDIKNRWLSHKKLIQKGIHPYFKSNEDNSLSYEILEECCGTANRRTRELLWAQRYKDKGYVVKNKDNFILL